MKNRYNKAHTLAEMLMVLVTIGIVMAILLASARKGRADASVRYAHYQQLEIMQTIAGEMLSNGLEMRTLPGGVVLDDRLNQLPPGLSDTNIVFNGSNVAVTGFCNAASNELNTVVGANCAAVNLVPDSNTAPSFETSSTVRFYNGQNAVGNTGAPYRFFIDVNGREGRSVIATIGDNNNKSDIFRFVVYPKNTDGYMVLPDIGSKALDVNFLSATLVSRPNGEAKGSQVAIPDNGSIDYRTAVCRSGRAPGAHLTAPTLYCGNNGAGAPAINAYSDQNGITCSGANNPCHVIVNKPAPPLKL